MTSRLLSVVDAVVDVKQTGFLPGRTSSCNVFALQLTIDDKDLISGMLIPVIFENSCDRVPHDFVSLCLDRMGFETREVVGIVSMLSFSQRTWLMMNR